MQTETKGHSISLEVEDSSLKVMGVLNFSNVVSVWQQGLPLIQNFENNIKVDLKGLLASDSSGLALFTAWVRAAREKNKAIVFINMPSFMQDVSKLCGLEGILPIVWEN